MLRAGLLIAVCTVGAQAAPHGKVVRIERHSRRFTGEPRWCGVSVENMQAFCYGKEPTVGAEIALLDNVHTIGTFQVDKVEPLGACHNPGQVQLWQVHMKGDIPNPGTPADSGVSGLIDVKLDVRTAKMVRVEETFPNRVPDSAFGFDLDGDNRADLATLSFTCDDNGEPVTALTASPNTCIEMWYSNGHGFEKLRTDKLSHSCL
ncbi:MAG: hypothetical protein QM831_44120 [Kofleriaceae bacterium]